LTFVDSVPMARDDKSMVGTVLCGLVLVITGNVFLWSQFATDLNFYTHQRPAKCVDGRPMGQSLMQSQLGVDDSERNKGVVTMQCSFPVAVYACFDQDIEEEEWNGECRTLANHPLYADGEWPRRVAEPGITCCERDCLNGNQCSDKEWSCSNGSCDAYEKSARICASLMNVQPYKCFAIEGRPNEGVREDASTFPVGFLIGGLAMSLCALACCCATVKSMAEEKDCLQKSLVLIMTVIACAVILIAIGAVVNAALGSADNQGLVERNYKDLAATTGTNGTGSNVTAVATEDPPPEGMHWALIVLIALGSVFGCLGLMICCGLALNYWFQEVEDSSTTIGKASPTTIGTSQKQIAAQARTFGLKPVLVQPASQV